MTSNRKLLNAVLVILISVPVYVLYKMSDARSSRCEQFIEVAASTEVISFIENWLEDSVLDKGFIDPIVLDGKAYTYEDGQMWYLDHPKWTKVGIDRPSFEINFKKSEGQSEMPLTSDNLDIIMIRDGRSQIFIKRNFRGDLSTQGEEPYGRKFKKVRDRVWVHCG